MTFKGKIIEFIDEQTFVGKIFGQFREKTNPYFEITTRERTRTLKQNNFYHLWIDFALGYYKMADPTWGHSELHEYFKNRFLKYWKDLNNEMIQFTRSTTDLSILEFSEFLENCFVQSITDCYCAVGLFQQLYEDWK
jgi:hypothetical protein